MLLSQTKISEQLRQENDELRKQLEFKKTTVDESDSLVEAQLKLDGVFEAAKKISDDIIADAEQKRADTEAYCRKMIEETQKGCAALIEQARENS